MKATTPSLCEPVAEADAKTTVNHLLWWWSTEAQILMSVVSIGVTYQVLQVFPFDFTGYSFAWDTWVRVLLVLAMVGSGIAALIEMLRLIGQVPEMDKIS